MDSAAGGVGEAPSICCTQWDCEVRPDSSSCSLQAGSSQQVFWVQMGRDHADGVTLAPWQAVACMSGMQHVLTSLPPCIGLTTLKRQERLLRMQRTGRRRNTRDSQQVINFTLIAISNCEESTTDRGWCSLKQEASRALQINKSKWLDLIVHPYWCYNGSVRCSIPIVLTYFYKMYMFNCASKHRTIKH